ncbi:hypothetical protein O1611_g6867 [Lasiodiplodia mahajangana]|uniref:Uncharacterized protein n=1 Tax=Lasiodiplodia mahajangana TaxID=1108764 RepID=A0ACC2JGX7_9PEZI|nr:hypothetical protein O1611_g6867 [Lasiodiplodia mahajangana]
MAPRTRNTSSKKNNTPRATPRPAMPNQPSNGAGPSNTPAAELSQGQPAHSDNHPQPPPPTKTRKRKPASREEDGDDEGDNEDQAPKGKRGRPASKKRSVPGDDAPFQFFQTRNLDDIPTVDMTNASSIFKNMRTTTSAEQRPQWWNNDWKYQLPGSDHIDEEEREFHLAAINTQRLCGQTFLYMLSTLNRPQDETAAAGCFHSNLAYCTFSDTEGKDFFGPFLYVKHEYNYGGVSFSSWDAVPQALTKAHQDPALHDLLQRVSEQLVLRSYLVRQGDIVLDFPEEEKGQIHIIATILATALAYLTLATTGPDSNERRFPKATAEDLKDRGDEFFYGYHSDHWVSALALIAQAGSRLKKGNAKSNRGPGTTQREKQHGLQLPRITSADLRLRTAGVVQQANPVEELALNNAAYLELLNAPLPEEHLPDSDAESIHDDMATKQAAQKRRKARVSAETLQRRLEKRFMFCMGSGAKFERWAIKNISARGRQAKSRGAAKKNDPLPPLTDRTIERILGLLARNFADVKQYKLDEASANAFSTVTNGADLKSFTAQQSSLLDSWASICAEQKGIDPEEARKQIDKLNQQSFIMTSALDADAPKEVDFVAACEALGLSDWKNLTLNPVNAPKMQLKPHQVADAYILRQMEESITKGGILANNVGTGKTVIMFLVIYQHLLELRQKKAKGEDIDALPSFIIVPASIITQVYQDFVRFFHGLLDIHLVYGRPEDYPQGGIRSATMSAAQWEKSIESQMANRDDPNNAMHVYVTSPHTAHRRFLGKKTWAISHRERKRGYTTPDDCIGYVADNVDDFSDPQWQAGSKAKRKAIFRLDSVSKRQKTASGEAVPSSDDLYDDEAADMSDDNGVRDHEHDQENDEGNDDALLQGGEVVKEHDTDGINPNTIVATYTQFRLKMAKVPDVMFARVIVDEAQCIRNPISQLNRMIGLIPKQRLLLVTATPTVNGKRDLRGALRLFDSVAKLPISIDEGDATHTLREEFDPTPLAHDSAEKFWTAADPALRERCLEYYKATGIKFWVLHKQVAKLLARQDEDTATDTVYNNARHLLQTRRHMKTPLTMPDGQKTFPGEQVPPMWVTFEEVGFKGSDARTISAMTTCISRFLHTMTGGKGQLPDYVDGNAPEEKGPALNYAMQRASSARA